MAVFMAGQLIGPVLVGSLADTLGDYRASFAVLALVAAAASLVFWFAVPPAEPPLRTDRSDRPDDWSHR